MKPITNPTFINPNVMPPGSKDPDYLTEAQRTAVDRLRERYDDVEFPTPMLFGDGAIVTHSVKSGMWFAIEKDGYCHT